MVTKHETGMPHNSQEATIVFQATNQTYSVVKAITDWPCFQIWLWAGNCKANVGIV